jgi:Cu(I)/Ag(I) efflux system membrane fusion protein
VIFDPRLHQKVAARVGGRIERLYFKYDYQYVRRGDRIMDIYSPELNTYQEEFLYLIHSGADTSLVEEGRKKLALLGLSPAQIHQLEKQRLPTLSFPVYSPFEGYILLEEEPAMETVSWNGSPSMEVAAEPSLETMGGGGATGMATGMKVAPSGERIREGQYVNRGQTLFLVNSFRQVWGLLSVEAAYQSAVRVGQPIQLPSSERNRSFCNCGFICPIREAA